MTIYPIKILESLPQETLEEKCGICHAANEEIHEESRLAQVQCCQRIYCDTCLINWGEQQQSCPVCRQQIEISDIEDNLWIQTVIQHVSCFAIISFVLISTVNEEDHQSWYTQGDFKQFLL